MKMMIQKMKMMKMGMEGWQKQQRIVMKAVGVQMPMRPTRGMRQR